MSEIIRVEYDGRYPTTCMGTLKIYEKDKVIYSKKYCCSSTGSVWFDDKWNEHVEKGVLVWDEKEAKKFDEKTQKAVKDKLSGYAVCCGGCI